jgi:hypothetical protein
MWGRCNDILILLSSTFGIEREREREKRERKRGRERKRERKDIVREEREIEYK